MKIVLSKPEFDRIMKMLEYLNWRLDAFSDYGDVQVAEEHKMMEYVINTLRDAFDRASPKGR